MEMKTSKILFTRQKHQADRAGFHYDIRLVHDNVAYSWATKKDIPEVGRSIILHEQPVHTASYALSEKVIIPKGNYGAGVTTLDFVRKADLTKNEEEGHFILSTGQGERYLLKHIPAYGPKQWLFRNLGPEREKMAESEGIQEEVFPPLADEYTILDPKPMAPKDKDKVPGYRFLQKIAQLHPDLLAKFKPDVTPEQMQRLGVLVGKYNEGKPEEGNYFKVDASLKTWPDKWHNEQHPLGWYEWYQGYHAGKRTSDDERQIKRWISFKARHLAQLKKADPTLQDLSIQPRRRQSMLHWGIAPGIDLEKKAVAVEMFQHDETGRKMWAPEGKAPSDRWLSTGKTKDVISNSGRKFSKDGTIFANRNGLLPSKPSGYYREYTLKANSGGNRGPVRMVCGGLDPAMPEVCYYTKDHYRTFSKMDMNRYMQKVASVGSMEKVALRRIVKEFASGKLMSSLKDLVNKGAIKPASKYAEGMRVGNNNIAKQVGATILRARNSAQKVVTNQSSGYAAIPSKGKGSTILTDVKNSPFRPNANEHQGMIRHELFETMDANAKRPSIRNHFKNLDLSVANFANQGIDIRSSSKLSKMMNHGAAIKPATVIVNINNKTETVATHFTPRVLSRESEMVRKNPHIQEKFQTIRAVTGENSLLKRITGKDYGIDKMTSKSHSKAFAVKPDSFQRHNHKDLVPVFDTSVK